MYINTNSILIVYDSLKHLNTIINIINNSSLLCHRTLPHTAKEINKIFVACPAYGCPYTHYILSRTNRHKQNRPMSIFIFSIDTGLLFFIRFCFFAVTNCLYKLFFKSSRAFCISRIFLAISLHL